MRKIAAILLICLLLFNWYGYRFVTNYLEKKADRQLNARLDVNDYDESQLMEIRVELHIPYQYSWSNFERSSGEIELNGKIYTYVKRKVEDGYLVLKCIPNEAKQTIQNANNILFTQNNGLDQEHNGKNNSPLKNVLKSIFSDYDNNLANYQFKFSGDLYQDPLQTGDFSLQSIALPVSEQPPESTVSS